MTGIEAYIAIVDGLSVVCCIVGVAVMLATPAGRRYAMAGAVPALEAPSWLAIPAVGLAFSGFPYEATAIMAAIACVHLGGPGISALWGLRRMGAAVALASGAIVWLGANPIKSAADALWAGMFQAMGWEMPIQPCIAEFVETPGSGIRLILAGWLCLEVPIVEEIAMTGLLYPWLKGRLNRAGAAFFTALAFALMHGYPIGIPLFVLHSLLVTWLFEITGSLLPAMGMHVAWNSVVIGGLWLANPCPAG